jgi:hypothetical protein
VCSREHLPLALLSFSTLCFCSIFRYAFAKSYTRCLLAPAAFCLCLANFHFSLVPFPFQNYLLTLPCRVATGPRRFSFTVLVPCLLALHPRPSLLVLMRCLCNKYIGILNLFPQPTTNISLARPITSPTLQYSHRAPSYSSATRPSMFARIRCTIYNFFSNALPMRATNEHTANRSLFSAVCCLMSADWWLLSDSCFQLSSAFINRFESSEQSNNHSAKHALLSAEYYPLAAVCWLLSTVCCLLFDIHLLPDDLYFCQKCPISHFPPPSQGDCANSITSQQSIELARCPRRWTLCRRGRCRAAFKAAFPYSSSSASSMWARGTSLCCKE